MQEAGAMVVTQVRGKGGKIPSNGLLGCMTAIQKAIRNAPSISRERRVSFLTGAIGCHSTDDTMGP